MRKGGTVVLPSDNLGVSVRVLCGLKFGQEKAFQASGLRLGEY